MLHMSVKELDMGDFLYTKGDLTPYFYFLLKGKIEIVAESTNPEGQLEMKFSKNVDEFEFFGQRKLSTETRTDFAKVVTEKGWVIQIDREQFEQIVKKTQLSVSE